MPYIGKAPIDRTLGISEKNTFTGDGSTVSFDMTSAAPEGGDTAVDVFVDNVRQEPGVGKAYVLAQDGSGDFKRITFSAAPPNGAEIWVNNRLRTQIIAGPSDNTVTTSKIANDAVTASKIANDAVTASEIADNAVTTSKIADNTVSGIKIAMGSDAQGDIIYYNGTDYVRHAAGTSGQFLKTQGGAANPVWGTVVTDPSMGGDLSGTASNASIVANAVDGTHIAMGSDAQGDIMYYNGTDYVRHAPGTSGQFLKTQGAAANPVWADVPAGAPTGGGTEKVFYENENSVDTNYTLTTNFNAVSAGPVTVASGITVTIPAGQAWVIV